MYTQTQLHKAAELLTGKHVVSVQDESKNYTIKLFADENIKVVRKEFLEGFVK